MPTLAEILMGGAPAVPMPNPAQDGLAGVPAQGGPVPLPQPPVKIVPPASQPAPQPAPQPEPEAVEEPVSKWQQVIDQMKDPLVAAPLQTFFAALSAPMSPWENGWSRLGRASQLMQLHKSMLAENAEKAPYEQEMRELDLQGRRLDVEGKSAQNRQRAADADVAEATREQRIQAATVELENARRLGDVRAEELAQKKLERALAEKYGDADRRLDQDNVRSQINSRSAQAARDAERLKIDRERATREAQTGTKDDPVWQRQLNVHRGVANSAIQVFKAMNPAATARNFYRWVREESAFNPDLMKAAQSIAILQAEGENPFAPLSRPAAAGPATPGPKEIDAATIRATTGEKRGPGLSPEAMKRAVETQIKALESQMPKVDPAQQERMRVQIEKLKQQLK